MSTLVEDWGTRLSDKIRRALAVGDFASALRLAQHGDGQARDLAREYAFMVHGLGFTLKALLRLLAERARQDGASTSLAALLREFAGVLHAGASDVREDAVPAQLAQACVRALESSQAGFAADQARRADEIVQALSARNPAQAAALLEAKDRAYLAVHDPLVRFMADGFAWVFRHFGAQGLVDFHLATAQAQRAGFEKWERMPARDFAATTAFLLRQHMGEVSVEEGERRFTIRQSPCGSGGRLRLQGAYQGPGALPFVESPGPLTFGEPRMPVYCTHCAIWNGSATLRWFGRAQWVFEQPAREDGGCTLHIYERREDAPADYTRRVALGGPEDMA